MTTTYNRGYMTEYDAQSSLDRMLESGELSESRSARVQPYQNWHGVTCYKITVGPLSELPISAEDRAEAAEWGRRAGTSGLSMKACPYAKGEPAWIIWRDAWTRAVEQRAREG